MPATAKQKLRAKRLAQLKRFLREHTWGVMITVLIMIALILFVCVIAGAAPKEAPAPETTQDETPRYESGFICAITTQVPYYTEELSEAGTVARGMQITYSTDKSVERDGIRYYLTYFSTLDCGYVSEENLTQDPAAVVAEKAVYVRTPQNLRVDKDTLELGTLVEKGAELQVLSYEGTTDGIVDLYQVAYQGQTGYISGQYVSTVQEEANDVYDRFGVYAIHAGRGDKWGGGDAESLDYFPRTKAEPVLRNLSYLRPGNFKRYRQVHRIRKIDEDQRLRRQHHGWHVHRLRFACVRGIFPHGVSVRPKLRRRLSGSHSENQGRRILCDRPSDNLQRLLLLPGSSRVRHCRRLRRAAVCRSQLLAECLLPLCLGV